MTNLNSHALAAIDFSSQLCYLVPQAHGGSANLLIADPIATRLYGQLRTLQPVDIQTLPESYETTVGAKRCPFQWADSVT